MTHYVFFADPTYPFTTLTVVRTKKDGAFARRQARLHGRRSRGWQPVGNGDYEIAYVKLVDHFNGMSGCNNGVQHDGLERAVRRLGVGLGQRGHEDRLGQLRLSGGRRRAADQRRRDPLTSACQAVRAGVTTLAA